MVSGDNLTTSSATPKLSLTPFSPFSGNTTTAAPVFFPLARRPSSLAGSHWSPRSPACRPTTCRSPSQFPDRELVVHQAPLPARSVFESFPLRVANRCRCMRASACGRRHNEIAQSFMTLFRFWRSASAIKAGNRVRCCMPHRAGRSRFRGFLRASLLRFIAFGA